MSQERSGAEGAAPPRPVSPPEHRSWAWSVHPGQASARGDEELGQVQGEGCGVGWIFPELSVTHCGSSATSV